MKNENILSPAHQLSVEKTSVDSDGLRCDGILVMDTRPNRNGRTYTRKALNEAVKTFNAKSKK